MRVAAKVKALPRFLLILFVLISLIGTLTLYSAGGMSWSPWALGHIIKIIFFMGSMLVMAMLPPKFWKKFAYPAYALAVLLLILTEIMGSHRGGAERWLELGGMTIQSSEIAKVALIFLLSVLLSKEKLENFNRPMKLLFYLGLIAIPALLVIKQPDLGTALLIIMLGIFVLIMAGLSWKWIISGLVLLSITVPLAWFFALHDYQKDRVYTFLDPSSDPSGKGYHIIQSQIAFGSGGLFGKGLGQGSQGQLKFLPESHTDFVLAFFAEEWGAVGVITLLALFTLIVINLYHFAYQARESLTKLLCTSFAFFIFLAVFINSGMVMGILPVVGVPLPLISNGGSMVMALFMGMGLCLSAMVHDQDRHAF